MDPAASESMSTPASSESLVGNVAVAAIPSLSQSKNFSSNDAHPTLSQSLNNRSVANSSLDRRWFRKYEQAMATRGPATAKIALAKRFHEEVYGAAADAQYRDHALAARLHSQNTKKDRVRKRDNITSSKESNNNSSAASSLNVTNPPPQPNRSPVSSQLTQKSPSIGPVRRPRDISTSLSSNEEIIPNRPARNINDIQPPVVPPNTNSGNAHTNLGAPRRYLNNPQPATGRNPRPIGDKHINGG